MNNANPSKKKPSTQSHSTNKNWFNKNLIILLIAIGIVLLILSALISTFVEESEWLKELGKAFMGLAFAVVIGGLIKLMFDKYSKEREKAEREKELRKEEKEREKEFKKDILNQLRKVFDEVDSSRILIEAHKSAKTYGEQMRQKIIPSIPALFDIKRSLVDAKEIFDNDTLSYLRVSIHYLIAYLRVLTEEYKEHYLVITNYNFYQEEIRKKIRDKFIDKKLKESADPLKEDFAQTLLLQEHIKKKIPQRPEFVWQQIEQKKYLKDFLSDRQDSWYYTHFIEHYEFCKRLLKGFTPKEPSSFDGLYRNILNSIDKKKLEGNLQNSDNLVALIMKEKMECPIDKDNENSPSEPVKEEVKT